MRVRKQPEFLTIVIYVYLAFFVLSALWALFYPGGLIEKLSGMTLATWPGNTLLMNWSTPANENTMLAVSFVVGFTLNILILWVLVRVFEKFLKNGRRR